MRIVALDKESKQSILKRSIFSRQTYLVLVAKFLESHLVKRVPVPFLHCPSRMIAYYRQLCYIAAFQ